MNTLRDESFYYQYEQNGGTVEMPKEVFWELYNDSKEEIERLNKEIGIRIQNSQYLVKKRDELEEMINELDEFLDYEIGYYREGFDDEFYEAYKIKNKLQELKGNTNEKD